MFSTITLLQESAGDAASAGYIQMLFFIGILAIFYLFLIRPQQKKAKQEKAFREALKKGDKVVTIGGMYGKIVGMNEETATILVDENVRIKFDKTALRAPAEAEAAPAKK
ncbi:MAG: preprotein translocase subunit YajC [Bacteroidota bacterium]